MALVLMQEYHVSNVIFPVTVTQIAVPPPHQCLTTSVPSKVSKCFMHLFLRYYLHTMINVEFWSTLGVILLLKITHAPSPIHTPLPQFVSNCVDLI